MLRGLEYVCAVGDDLVRGVGDDILGPVGESCVVRWWVCLDGAWLIKFISGSRNMGLMTVMLTTWYRSIRRDDARPCDQIYDAG